MMDAHLVEQYRAMGHSEAKIAAIMQDRADRETVGVCRCLIRARTWESEYWEDPADLSIKLAGALDRLQQRPKAIAALRAGRALCQEIDRFQGSSLSRVTLGELVPLHWSRHQSGVVLLAGTSEVDQSPSILNAHDALVRVVDLTHLFYRAIYSRSKALAKLVFRDDQKEESMALCQEVRLILSLSVSHVATGREPPAVLLQPLPDVWTKRNECSDDESHRSLNFKRVRFSA